MQPQQSCWYKQYCIKFCTQMQILIQFTVLGGTSLRCKEFLVVRRLIVCYQYLHQEWDYLVMSGMVCWLVRYLILACGLCPGTS